MAMARSDSVRSRQAPPRTEQGSRTSKGRFSRGRRPRWSRASPRRSTVGRAKSLLSRFRRSSLLAVVVTSLLLLIVDADASSGYRLAQDAASTNAPGVAQLANDVASSEPSEGIPSADRVAEATGDEAKRAIAGFRDAVGRNLPRFTLVLAVLIAAWLVVRILRFIFRRALRQWPRSSAIIALSGVAVWTLALGVSVTVIAGDVRAFLGSVGLLGLAASWALQTPIESFTGWLLNAFRGYYRVGDRIEVGEVFGDVHRIDVLTTTVWEIGSPFRPGFVRAEQPTGKLITFPNNQILNGSVMNLTRDFPFLWDELTVAVANESDLRYAAGVLESTAADLLGERMRAAAPRYEQILQRSGLDNSVPAVPEVFVSVEDAWTSLTIRYLVHARQRRRAKSELVLRLADVLNRPEHARRIIPVIPRQQLQLIDDQGLARNAAWFEPLELEKSAM